VGAENVLTESVKTNRELLQMVAHFVTCITTVVV